MSGTDVDRRWRGDSVRGGRLENSMMSQPYCPKTRPSGNDKNRKRFTLKLLCSKRLESFEEVSGSCVRRLKSTLFRWAAQTRKGAPVVSPVSLRRLAPEIRDGGPSDPRFFPGPPLALGRDPHVLLPFETLALLSTSTCRRYARRSRPSTGRRHPGPIVGNHLAPSSFMTRRLA
jgi:hypothetical protein